MTLTLTEGALDALRDYLKAAMPAKVAQINERSTDDIVARVPGLYAIGEPELVGVSEWPICYLVSSGFELEDFKVQTGALYVKARHALSVGVIVVDSEPERLTRLKLRTVQCVFELVLESLASPGSTGAFSLVGKPSVKHLRTYAQGDEYLSEGFVDFAVTQQEFNP